jgi:predicted cupin superfamily sugar epimerase
VWHFYDGSAITLYIIEPDRLLLTLPLGLDTEKGEQPQTIVKANRWFAAKPNDVNSYSLVGCTMSPGFDFEDFEMGKRSALIKQFPQHKDIIEDLSKTP